MSASYISISPDKLSRLIGTAAAPTLIDVGIDEDVSADPRLVPAAIRCSHLDVQDWTSRVTGQSVVLICHKGNKFNEGRRPGRGAARSPAKGESTEVLVVCAVPELKDDCPEAEIVLLQGKKFSTTSERLD
jgi:hypothetical protein